MKGTGTIVDTSRNSNAEARGASDVLRMSSGFEVVDAVEHPDERLCFLKIEREIAVDGNALRDFAFHDVAENGGLSETHECSSAVEFGLGKCELPLKSNESMLLISCEQLVAERSVDRFGPRSDKCGPDEVLRNQI